MPEQFNSKDYGEYFSAVQKSIEKKAGDMGAAQAITSNKENRPQKAKSVKLRPWVSVTAVLVVVATVLAIVISAVSKKDDKKSSNGNQSPALQNAQNQAPDVLEEINNYAKFTEKTAAIDSDVESQNIIIINCKTNEVVAARNAKERCYPASTTKIMTVLTACDYITDFEKTFTFSYEITDPLYVQEATMAGFLDSEAVNMTDLLYGAILPSGADATVGLALSVAGSEEEFVKLMNKKAAELGLKNTNFVNSSGLYNPNHYTTPEDMSVIVRAAMENELCRKILSTYQYTTAPTAQHPEGILLTSTMFSRMYGTEPEGSDILGGKTGFVNESGHCLATFGTSDGGNEYICVTFKGTGAYPIVYDQIKLYTRYAK